MIPVGCGRAVGVLLAAFGIQFFTAVLVYGTGIIHLSLLDAFQRDDASTSVVGSLFVNLMSITGPLASYFIERWSCRVTVLIGGILLVVGLVTSSFVNSFWLLLVTNGIISGVGNGLTLLPCPVSVGYSFRDHSGLAMGIMTAGVGIGMLASGPLIQYLLETYGLSGTYLMSAAIVSHVIPCGMLLKTPPKKSLTPAATKHRVEFFKTYIKIVKVPSFMFVLVGSILWNIAYAVIMIHLPNFVVQNGSSRSEASFLFTVIGIGTILSRLTVGLATGPNGLDPLLLNFGLTALMGAVIVTFPLYVTHPKGPMIFASLYGIYSGGLLVFTLPLCLEFVGMQHLNSALGLWYLLLGLGSLIGPPLAGLVFDLTGSFDYSYIFSGLFVLSAAACSLFASVWRKPKNETGTTRRVPEIWAAAENGSVVVQDQEVHMKEQSENLISNDI